MEKKSPFRSDRGSAMLMAVTLIIVLLASILIGGTVIGTVQQEQVGMRARARLESTESLVVNAAAIEAVATLEKLTINATVGGYVDILSTDMITELQQRTRARLNASNLASRFPGCVTNPNSVTISRPTMAVYDGSSGAIPYADSTLMHFTGKPYILKSAPTGLANPYSYVDFVPVHHPLAGMQVRRFPMAVSFDYTANGTTYRVTRQFSYYQVPVAQFSRFSSGQMNLAAQTNVSIAANAQVFSFGSMSGAGSSAFSRLWASQVDTFATVTGAGGEADRLFNLGTVALAQSRIGSRLTGETWSLAAPHFYGTRNSGEKIPGTTRPIPTIGSAAAKAYEAKLFFETIYHPDTVSAANPSSGAITVNIYDATGTVTTSVSGVMRGTAAVDTPGFEETILDSSGNYLNSRTNHLSSFGAIGASERSVATMDLIAPYRGQYSFRATNGAGTTVKLDVDGIAVLNTSSAGANGVITIAPGRHSVTMSCAGGGNTDVLLTPPGLNEAYLSQWSVRPDTEVGGEGTFTQSLGTCLSWRILPTEERNNTTGSEAVALILHLDQPWPMLTANTDPVIYVEGVRSGSSRYFTSGSATWAQVVTEVTGDVLHSDVSSRNSVTIMSANPVVITGNLGTTNYHGLYIISRGIEAPDTNCVYLGYQEAFTKHVDVTGVVGGSTADLPSYFDRANPNYTHFSARSASQLESNPFFKTLVLIDDFVAREDVIP